MIHLRNFIRVKTSGFHWKQSIYPTDLECLSGANKLGTNLTRWEGHGCTSAVAEEWQNAKRINQ